MGSDPGFCLPPLREKVEMERAGRDEAEELDEPFVVVVVMVEEALCLSGDRDCATVEEGVLLCEDDVWVLALPDESFVRSEALRERCSWTPKSPRVDEMLCRDGVLVWRGGVVRMALALGGRSWKLSGMGGGRASSGLVEDSGGSWMTGGRMLVGVLGGLDERPPKKEGRREKMLDELEEEEMLLL